MLPLIGTALLSIAGQIGLKLAISLGKKMFGKGEVQSDPESFPALLKKQLDPTAAAPAASPSASLAQPPQGLQAMVPTVATDVPIATAVSAYRRLESPWPGRSLDTGPISLQQAP